MSVRNVILTVLLALLMPSAASAAPDWVPAITFPVPGNAFMGQDEVRYQNGGVATEAFLEVQSVSPLQTTLHLGTLPPGGSYSDQLTVPRLRERYPRGLRSRSRPMAQRSPSGRN